MRYLITAGPTREAIDPVRYISNRSSGKMGYSLAAAAAYEGHRVVLISGPTSLDIPSGVDFLPVETAQEMYEATERQAPYADVAILCAAVADYRPVNTAEQKIKKHGETITLELERTPDILGAMRDTFGFQGTLIGFAAETNNVVSYAQGKRLKKKCDMIVANDVSRKDIGFDVAENEVILVTADGEETLPKDTKEQIAIRVIEKAGLLHRLKKESSNS